MWAYSVDACVGRRGVISLLGCHYLQGWVSEGHNDDLVVWALKSSIHTEVEQFVCVCACTKQVFVYVP